MIISPTRLINNHRVLRELEGIYAKFSFQKCVLGTPAVLESVLGKSSAIAVTESCLSHDVTRALFYWCFITSAYGTERYIGVSYAADL